MASEVTTLNAEPADSHEPALPPYHVFTPAMKNFIVFNVSAVAALSGLSSNIYFPAQQDISVVSINCGTLGIVQRSLIVIQGPRYPDRNR